MWRACNLTSFSPCLTGPVTTRLLPVTRYLGSNPQGGTYVKPGFLLLVLSRYKQEMNILYVL
jgi:hypothetical protein